MHFDAKTAYRTLKSCHLVNLFNLVLKLRTPLLNTRVRRVSNRIFNASVCSTSAVSAKIILLDADQMQFFCL